MKSSLGPGHAKRAILVCYLEGQKLFGCLISMGIRLQCLLEIFSRKGGGGRGVIPVLHSQSYKVHVATAESDFFVSQLNMVTP